MPEQDALSLTTRVYRTQWFSLPAQALESPALRVITVPEMGGKIVSVFDRLSEREWLLPPREGHFQPAAYGASFIAQDMSGWDEMFPTIDRCAYPDGALLGRELPDHGDVWALAWEHDESAAGVIRLRVRGRALPYSLSRTIHLTSERNLRLSYEVVVTGAEPLSALWAAHPQFAADEATRIILPASVTRVISVQPTDEFPVVGQQCGWVETLAQDGRVLLLDRLSAVNSGKYRKFYLLPEQPVAWAGLRQENDGAWLRLSWNAADIPYLGIWVDEGAFNAASTIALEPATGFYDSLARAWAHGRVMRLLPGTPYRWSLDLTVGSDDFPAEPEAG